MGEKTRTVMLWYNRDEARLTLAVNPRQMTVTRTQEVRTFRTLTGEPVEISRGRGLRKVRFATFLPAPGSRFYQDITPQRALDLLHRWQDSRRPVRLVVSGTDLNGLYLLTKVEQTIAEGDRDIGIGLELSEVRQGATVPLTGPGGPVLAARTDERALPNTYPVQPGDTLWRIARCLYGDGTRWRAIAVKNGLDSGVEPAAGQVLIL